MAVNAIARVESITIQTNQYVVGLYYFATDGTNTFEGGTSAEIPFTWGVKRANRFIRERIATTMFAAYSLTIDPEDIFIPLF